MIIIRLYLYHRVDFDVDVVDIDADNCCEPQNEILLVEICGLLLLVIFILYSQLMVALLLLVVKISKVITKMTIPSELYTFAVDVDDFLYHLMANNSDNYE